MHGDQTLREEDDTSEQTMDDSAKSPRVRQNEGTTNEESLLAKLESLRAMRAEIVDELDEDIQALEKALRIIRNDYS